MSKDKDTERKWKLEGEAFERIKVKRDALEKVTEEGERLRREAHKALWDAIHEELPETEKEKNYSINPSFESLGFYVVQENEGGGLKGLLGALALKAALSD